MLIREYVKGRNIPPYMLSTNPVAIGFNIVNNGGGRFALNSFTAGGVSCSASQREKL